MSQSRRAVELELLEEYTYANEKRYRFKLRGTDIVINVSADNVDEGMEKAVEILKKIGLLPEIR
jgi:hypothetical protein